MRPPLPLILSALAVWLAAPALAGSPAWATAPTPTPTVAPPRDPAAHPGQARAALAPAEFADCEPAGSVQFIRVPSATLGYPIDTRVYLPPCFDASRRRYPVLYLLHGLGFTQSQWQRLGVPAAADQLIAAGRIAPLIIVMPRDRRDDRLDPALVDDLIPYIDGAYPTIATRAARAVGGLSRGGGWAIHFGLHYPELFSRLGLHSPAVFYGDDGTLLGWARQLKLKPKPTVYIDSGENDATLRSPVWIDQVLTWFNVEHTFIIQAGSHTEAYWAAHVRDYLLFYAAGWRSLPPEPAGPDPLTERRP